MAAVLQHFNERVEAARALGGWDWSVARVLDVIKGAAPSGPQTCPFPTSAVSTSSASTDSDVVCCLTMFIFQVTSHVRFVFTGGRTWCLHTSLA